MFLLTYLIFVSSKNFCHIGETHDSEKKTNKKTATVKEDDHQSEDSDDNTSNKGNGHNKKEVKNFSLFLLIAIL